MSATEGLRPERLAEITCGHASCEDPAACGGIVIVQPNCLTPSHAVYYACDRHSSILANAAETWPVVADGPADARAINGTAW